jgi:hypothetical protein
MKYFQPYISYEAIWRKKKGPSVIKTISPFVRSGGEQNPILFITLFNY